jgi:hypothetical protein
MTAQVATITLATTRTVNKLIFTIAFLKNPNSASAIIGVSTVLLTGSVTRASMASSQITGFTPDKLVTAKVASSSNTVAQSGTTLKISFTPKNTLRAMDKGRI